MTTEEQIQPVCVTRCSHCGLEVTAFEPYAEECDRCGRQKSQQIARWINRPHPATVEVAKSQNSKI